MRPGDLAAGVCLPEAAGGGVEAGEEAVAAGVGVDADGVAEVERMAGFLWCVAANDCLA